MHPRTQESLQLLDDILQMQEDIKAKLSKGTTEKSAAYTEQCVHILSLQCDIVLKLKKVVSQLDNFNHFENDAIAELNKLDSLMIEWQKAQESCKGKGISDFLDAVEPKVALITDSFKSFQSKAKIKEDSNALSFPSIEELEILKSQMLLIQPFVDKISANIPKHFVNVLDCIVKAQSSNLEIINMRIRLVKQLIATRSNSTSSYYKNSKEFIKNYEELILGMFRLFDKLSDLEYNNADEVSLQEAFEELNVTTQAIRDEGKNLTSTNNIAEQKQDDTSLSKTTSSPSTSVTSSPLSSSVKGPNTPLSTPPGTPPSSDEESPADNLTKLPKLALAGPGNVSESKVDPKNSFFKSTSANEPKKTESTQPAVKVTTSQGVSAAGAESASKNKEKTGGLLSKLFAKTTPAKVDPKATASSKRLGL